MEEQQNQRQGEEQKMDNFFHASLGNARIDPPVSAWRSIRRRLLWKEISHFNFTNISRVTLIGGGMGIILVSILIYYATRQENPQSEHKSLSRNEIRNEIPANVSGTSVTTASRNIAPATPAPAKTPEIVIPEKKTATPPATFSYRKSVATGGGKSSTSSLTGKFIASKGTLKQTTTGMGSVVNTNRDRNSLALLPSLGIPFSLPVKPGIREPQKVIEDIRPIQPLNKPQGLPQHLAAGLSVSPEMTFYRTDHSYSLFDIYGDVNFTYYFGKFYFRPGIGLGYYYDQSTGTVDFKTNDSIGYYTEVVSYTIHENQIVYNTIRKPIFDSVIHSYTETLNNRYLCLQVPLLLGMNIFESGNFRVGILMGPVVSFLIGKHEPEPDGIFPNSRIIRIQNYSKERVLTNWQVWAGLDFEYGFWKHFSLSASPEFRYFLNPVINNEVNHGFHPYSAGINIGLNYHFAYKNQRP
ncbi:MAG: outer membrane beta-barrel protein [Bacteroidota bacterium]|nr:outer membrane beta-barrel protein [Bacteroidota bacterium]